MIQKIKNTMKTHIISLAIALFFSLTLYAQENSSEDQLAEANSKYFAENANSAVNNQSFTGKVTAFYEDGTFEEKGYLKAGKKHGSWKKYSKSGELINVAQYSNGLKDGTWIVYDENGTKRLEFHYDQGKRTGTWLMFDENGKETSRKTY
jgi:antitoxin component YwqK of YwqJK toxin-antitoxin module